MTAVGVADRVGDSTTPADPVDVCVTVLGADLTAYLSGADSVEEFESWRSGAAGPDAAARRLAAAAEIVNIFAAWNMTAMTGPWLREVDSFGYTPARLLRRSTGDAATVKVLHDAAAAYARGELVMLAAE